MIRLWGAAAAAAAWLAAGTAAQAEPIGARDSFRIGSGGGALCTAQALLADQALLDMFDRGYAILCRDAALPVGHVYALRRRGGDPLPRLAALRAERASCRAGADEVVDGVGTVETLDCRLNAADVGYRVYEARKGRHFYAAEGLLDACNFLRCFGFGVRHGRHEPGGPGSAGDAAARGRPGRLRAGAAAPCSASPPRPVSAGHAPAPRAPRARA